MLPPPGRLRCLGPVLSLKRRYGSGYKLSVALQELLEAGAPGLGAGRKLLEAGEPGLGAGRKLPEAGGLGAGRSGEAQTGGGAQDGEAGEGREAKEGKGEGEEAGGSAVERLRGLVEGCLGVAGVGVGGSKAGGVGGVRGRQGGSGGGGVAVELGRSHVHFQVRLWKCVWVWVCCISMCRSTRSTRT